MEIKCTHCGEKNLLGQIHCRRCYQKLDVDSMRPEVKEKNFSFPWLKTVKNIVVLGLLLFVIVVAWMLFQKPVVETPAVDAKEAEKKIEKLDARLTQPPALGRRINNVFEFTPGELRTLFQQKIQAKESGDINALNDFIIEVVDGEVIVFMDCNLGKLPGYYRVSGSFAFENGAIAFTPNRVHMGKVPLYFLQDTVYSRFEKLANAAFIKLIYEAAEKIEINENGNFVLTIKKGFKPKVDPNAENK